jgi:hypothetical protein
MHKDEASVAKRNLDSYTSHQGQEKGRESEPLTVTANCTRTCVSRCTEGNFKTASMGTLVRLH